MSFFDKLARLLGLSEPPPADSPGSGASIDTAPHSHARSTHSPYAELWQSVDRHLAQFMVHSVLPHRQFEPDDVFKLVRIQVTGTTPTAQNAIDRFLAEFRPDSRRKVVLAAVKRNCAEGVSTEGFVDFNRDFERAELDDSDPYDAQLAEAHQAGYQLTLYGEWELQRPVFPGSQTRTVATNGSATAALQLDIDVTDANGKRQLRIGALPFVIGRTGTLPGHAVNGRFVSRRHGLLERDDQGDVWYRETSVNGSSIDGIAIQPGERRRIRNGARLRLGGEGSDALECPELVIHWPAAEDEGGYTPIRSPLHSGSRLDQPTPIRSSLANGEPAPSTAVTPLSAARPAPLCLLAVKDAHGSRTVPVTRLPYVIGRGEHADCRVPEDNAGVSRDHLVLEAVDSVGAQVGNNGVGKWGTEVDGTEQPARFTLMWGQQVTLAGRFKKAPFVTVLLLPSS